MFQSLTRYLLRYHKVSIPYIGTIQIIPQPAQVNVVDQLITPPAYTTELSGDESVSDHQLSYLASAINSEKEDVKDRLAQLGKDLHARIVSEPLSLSGIGIIGGALVTPLEPIDARKVLREDAEHTVLVGDNQVTVAQEVNETEQPIQGRRRSVSMLIGWILLAVSIAAIIFIFSGETGTSSTGLQTAP